VEAIVGSIEARLELGFEAKREPEVYPKTILESIPMAEVPKLGSTRLEVEEVLATTIEEEQALTLVPEELEEEPFQAVLEQDFSRPLLAILDSKEVEAIDLQVGLAEEALPLEEAIDPYSTKALQADEDSEGSLEAVLGSSDQEASNSKVEALEDLEEVPVEPLGIGLEGSERELGFEAMEFEEPKDSSTRLLAYLELKTQY